MLLIIRDTESVKSEIYPLAQTYEAWDLRFGIFTIREKWELILGQNAIETEKGLEFSNFPENKSILGSSIPSLEMNTAELAAIERYLTHINSVTDILDHQTNSFLSDFAWIQKNRKSQTISTTCQVINEAAIFIEEGAELTYAILNAANGPIYIGKNANVMEGTCIRGPFAMGERAVVKMGTRIYPNTFIGNETVVGGELKNTTIQDYSNKGHDGYLGDAIIGQWCNLGAGTSASNVKNNASDVRIWSKKDQQFVSTGLKRGLIMGDYSKAAINTSFNTGTLVGVACNVFTSGLTPKYIPDFSWGVSNEQLYDIEKLTVDIESWKKFKNKTLTTKEKQKLARIFERNLNHL